MKRQPLAYRMRPKHIDEIIGQDHLVKPNKILHRMVDAGSLSSMILFGPPGTGKTSLAISLAESIQTRYKLLNAVTDKKKDMEIAVEEAKMQGSLILILDEVHRLDKGRQDFLLPHIESNLITLIGCTTSNPFHSINPAIRSRCHLFELHPLQMEQIKEALHRAITDEENGFGKQNIKISDQAMEHFIESAHGDLRQALNGIELAILSTPKNEDQMIVIDLPIAEECMQKKSFSHDKDGDHHYDVLSAFQKSIRGSDVHASLHYLARLIEAGDLESICRRMLVTAYEDIGLANPQAGPRTLQAIQAAERLGLPEARIPLAVQIVELALSPKSNTAYKALDAAIHDIRHSNIGHVPDHLKDSHYAGAKKIGRGTNYQYPHNYDQAWVNQQYLPDELIDRKYYKPKDHSKFEQNLKRIYENIEKQK